jgi:protein involved in polysaccharide export with SLBB domain
MKIKFLLAFFFLFQQFCVFNSYLNAQAASVAASPILMQQINSELQKRGLSESEVRARLLQKGIDLENIPPTELPNYKSKVMIVLDELTAEKRKQIEIQNQNSVITPSNNSQLLSPHLTMPTTTLQEAESEKVNEEIRLNTNTKNKSDDVFGHSLFTNKSLAIYRTTDGAQAPDTYVLGEGDEVHISIFGASQTDIQLRIAADGAIQPTGSSKIFLKGLTLAQSREVIKKSLSSSYLFRSDQMVVTISTARTILVNVFGESKNTGGFTLSALNSAFNALSAAGGPTAIGSLRNIQLIRGSSRRNIDLYTFIKDPAAQHKYDLQNNDILFLPVAQTMVSIQGAVNRPMQYEMLQHESVVDLIDFAGGLSKNAYPNFIQISRYENGEQKLMEFNLTDVMNGKLKIPLVNGDSVQIKSISKKLDQYVEISGSVYYPGRYDLYSNSNLSSLIQKAKPDYQAKTDLVFVERLQEDSTFELISVPFSIDKNIGQNFNLKARDKIKVMNRVDYRDVDTISVNGYVRLPFQKVISLTEKISVKQALEMAGGLKASVYPIAYIYRRNMFNRAEIQYIKVDLKRDLDLSMQAGDRLNIFDGSRFSNVGNLKIFGAVKTSKSFTFDESMTVQDLIINAGGFTIGAAYNRVEVFRSTISPSQRVKLDLISLVVDSSYQVISPKNFKLQPFDQIVVRYTPEFKLQRTIEINGQVKYPGVYVLESRQTQLSDVIRLAGGLLIDADPYGTQLFRTYNNRGSVSLNVKQAIKHSHREDLNPILFEGDVVNINRLENTVSILETGTRMGQYSTMSDSNDSVKNVVFHGYHSAAWYVRHFAGGFQKNVDYKSVTVTYPNNQMESTKRLFWIYIYPKVVPGSLITMNMDSEKVKQELEPEKKLDIETTVSKSLSTLTSTLSIILLLDRLIPKTTNNNTSNNTSN